MVSHSIRINQLLEHFHRSFNNKQDSKSQEQTECFKCLIREIYSKNIDNPAIMRKTEFLEAFAEKIPVTIDDSELIVGSHWFHHAILEDKENSIFSRNMGHILVNYGEFMTQGVTGIESKVLGIHERNETVRTNKVAFLRTLNAFSVFVRRYGEGALEIANCCDDAMQKMI